MLGQLSALSKIESLLVKLNSQSLHLNSTLPVSIDVKKQLSAQSYLLDVGKKEMKTHSNTELEVGRKYWAMMKEEGATKGLSLSKLVQKPLLLGNKKALLPTFDLEHLQQLLTHEKPKEAFKLALLDKMTTVTSKQDFLTLSNMLQALNENVFSFVLSGREKETLFQLKKRKNRDKKESNDNAKIDFYAAFESLGPVEGVVEVADGKRKLSLYLYYENSLQFLQEELKSLDLEGFLYQKEGKISPLYEYGESLLDVKG